MATILSSLTSGQALAGGVVLLLLAIISPLLYNFFWLRGVPGPFWARFSDFWRLLVVRRGDAHDTYMGLHRKYGNLVRIGPNCVSVAGYDAIQGIYSLSAKLNKSEFYPVQQGILNGKPYVNLFTTTSNDHHAIIKRPVARAYAMTTLLEYEPFVDTTTNVFLSRLDELYASQSSPICDLGIWLAYYAFDVVGEMTFSSRFGFLETASDIGGVIQSLRNVGWLFQLAQMPWTDRLFRKNRFQLRATQFTTPVVRFTIERLRERIAWPGGEWSEKERKRAEAREGEGRWERDGKKDMLGRFLDARELHPDVVDNTRVLSYAQGNVTAGSDTTAITLRAIMYHLLRNPSSLHKLQDEVDAATAEGRLSVPCVSWSESQKLPYLGAVVKEAFRIHPAVGLPLERVVSNQGLTLYGTYFPPGTIVGINPWVMHRDREIFGQDADEWRPERWLEMEAEGGARRKRMEGAWMPFGSGARTCIGKNISLLEVYKLVPTLIRRYDFKLADPNMEWELVNAFFVHQYGLNVKVRRRDVDEKAV